MARLFVALLLGGCTSGFDAAPEDKDSPVDTEVLDTDGEDSPVDSDPEVDSDPAPDTETTAWSFPLELDGAADECPASARFPTSSGTDSWSCITWTEADLFLAFSHPDVATGGDEHFAWAYLWLGEEPATTDGVLYNTQQPTLPATFSHHVRIKPDGSYASVVQWDGTEWVDDPAFFDAQGAVVAGGVNQIELRIPRTALGTGSTLRLITGWLFEGDNFESTYAMVPDSSADGYDADPSKAISIDLLGAASPSEHELQP